MPFPSDQIAWMTSNRATVFRYARFLQVITGLILLAASWTMGKTNFHLIRKGLRTQGRIVTYHQEYFPRSGTATFRSAGYMPVVEYRLEDRIVRFQDWLGKPQPSASNVAV